MRSQSRSTLAVYFGSVFVLALVASFFIHEPKTTTGQVVRTPTDSAIGFTVAPDTHVFFSCAVDGPLLADGIGNISNYAFWVYEFTGDEPQWNGKYFMSPQILQSRQLNASYNTLNKITANKRYYIRSETPILFRCDTGIRPQPRCGNGIIEGNELCDSVTGCTNVCTVATGYECNTAENSCVILVPTIDEQSSSSLSSASSASYSFSASSVESRTSTQSSSLQSSSISALSVSSLSSKEQSSSVISQENGYSSVSSASSFSSAISSQVTQPAAPVEPTGPVVEFDKFEMEYITVPSSNTLQKGNDFTFAVRIKNKASGPRTFQIVHNTGVMNTAPTDQISTSQLNENVKNIAPNLQNQDDNCETKSLPYFGRWRTFCKYVLSPGEERVLPYTFSVEQDISCALSLYANATIYAKAATYDKQYDRTVRIFPSGCDSSPGATSDISCPVLAAIQGDPKYTVISSSDKSLFVYKYTGDNDSISRSLSSIDPATCTKKEIVRPTDIPETMRIGEMYISDNKDILYETSAWYVSSGHFPRSINRIDGQTGKNVLILPNIPSNSGAKGIDFSPDGKKVVFIATSVDIDNDPLTSYSNADGSTEAFLWEDGLITQITNFVPRPTEGINYSLINSPRFIKNNPNNLISISAGYNPKTGEPHAQKYTRQNYFYDMDTRLFQ